MSQKRDFYQVLGVARDADAATIKKAYRKLAVELHPDRNPGDKPAEEKFKEAAEAYQVLADPEQRATYDRFGHDAPRGGFGGFSDVSDIFSAFGDIFGDMFGGRGGGGRGARGADLETEVGLTLAETATGATKDIEVTRHVGCEPCSGSGAAPGSRPERCRTCRGSGQVVHSQGFLMISTACPECRGAGQVIKDPCKECRGSGLVKKTDTLQVAVPAGVDDGSTLRLAGRGQAAPGGGRTGNLYVHIRVEADPRFEREGANLHAVLRLSFAEAALGADRAVESLDRKEEIPIKVEPGTQPGETIVLRGRGLPDVQSGRKGDLVVHCQVVVPRKLDKDQRERLRAFADIMGDDSSDENAGAGKAGDKKFGAFFRRKKT